MSVATDRIDNVSRGFGGAKDTNQALNVADYGIFCEAEAGESGIKVLEGGIGERKVSLVETVDLKKMLEKSEDQVSDNSDSAVKISSIDDYRVKDIARSELGGNGVTVDVKDEFKGISLTVELHPSVNEENSSECTDKTKQKCVKDAIKVKSRAQVFGASDLIWGKVRSHPWWPGQVFDASAASDEAKKHYKKGGFLIAYFGDQSFAWNGVGSIKPFKEHFSRMEKQSNSEDFSFAIDRALDEISRRVECELSCSCLPEEVYKKLRTQKMVNYGIRKESCEREGGDCSWKATSFDPRKFIAYIKKIAVSPVLQSDRLDFVTEKACLCAFYRWKGYIGLPELNTIHGLYESAEDVSFPSEKVELVVHTGISPELSKIVKKGTRKGKSGCPLDSKKTKKSLLKLMASESVSEAKDLHMPLSSLLGMKRKDRDVTSDDSAKSSKPRLNPETEQAYIVGDKIMKVLSKIGKSKPNEKTDLSHKSMEHSIQNSSPDKLLSDLTLMARESGNPHIISFPIIMFFSKFRDSICLEKQQGISFEDLQRDPEDVHETLDINDKGDGDSTVLILKFTNSESIPAEETLNKIFERFGSLMESETRVLKKSNKAKVVFKKQSDAEAAFSSSGKYSVFGPSLVSYRINYAASYKPSRAKKRTV